MGCVWVGEGGWAGWMWEVVSTVQYLMAQLSSSEIFTLTKLLILNVLDNPPPLPPPRKK